MGPFLDAAVAGTPSEQNKLHSDTQNQVLEQRLTSPLLEKEAIKAPFGSVPRDRIIFMGTPLLAAGFLTALIEAGYNIVSVVTKPDKPIGRDQELSESKVKEVALAHDIPVLTPTILDEDFVDKLQTLKPDLFIVVAYGKILPKSILEIPRYGALNVHASLLPRFRGASPIQNAILLGDAETGVTLMLMNEGVDTGPIIAQNKFPIGPNDMQSTVTSNISVAGQKLLLEALPLWMEKKIFPQEQQHDDATLCQLIEREDGHILWSDSAESIYNRYRALTPWPGLYTFTKKNDSLLRFKLIAISFQKTSPQTEYPIGRIFELGEKVGVQTGEGVVFLEEVKLEGKGAMKIRDFLAGNADLIGSTFH